MIVFDRLARTLYTDDSRNYEHGRSIRCEIRNKIEGADHLFVCDYGYKNIANTVRGIKTVAEKPFASELEGRQSVDSV